VSAKKLTSSQLNVLYPHGIMKNAKKATKKFSTKDLVQMLVHEGNPEGRINHKSLVGRICETDGF